MAKANHTPPVTPKPLGHCEAFKLLDAADQARTRLKSTIALLTVVIDSNREFDEGVVLTLERFINADIEALDNAFAAAWDGILKPLHAIAHPGVIAGISEGGAA